MKTITPGIRGPAVLDVQSRLLALGFHIEAAELAEQVFGGTTEQAVRTFQQERGLLVDGLVGPQTWQELVEAGYALADRLLYLRKPPFRGDDVRALQRRLNVLGFDPGREDGIFGEQTSRAVREFQTNVGLRADGIAGATTIGALDRLFRAPGKGPGRIAVRETEAMRSPAAALPGRRIAIDPGHGPADPGAVGPAGLTEAEATLEMAERLAAELQARGAEPLLLRGPDETPEPSDRASRANEAAAEVLVSIHLNSHEDPSADGASAYYFGSLGAVSVAGQTLAELFQEEVVGATGLRDGRTHPKSFPILRETQMPAVHVEPCFITNPKEERLLTEEPFLRETALAMTRALDRFFAGTAARAGQPGES